MISILLQWQNEDPCDLSFMMSIQLELVRCLLRGLDRWKVIVIAKLALLICSGHQLHFVEIHGIVRNVLFQEPSSDRVDPVIISKGQGTRSFTDGADCANAACLTA